MSDQTGWKFVPVEPTEDMVVEGFESWPDPLFSKPEDWDAYEAMTGCQQAAYKARLCYSAMLRAAPSPSMPNALTPEWLWCEFMDYCRKRGVAPANMNDLFEIVKRARTMLTAPLPASTNRLTDEQIVEMARDHSHLFDDGASIWTRDSLVEFARALLSATEKK